MPRGPKGEKRPADVIGNAVHVMRKHGPARSRVSDRPPFVIRWREGVRTCARGVDLQPRRGPSDQGL
jgi:hypothetical protein